MSYSIVWFKRDLRCHDHAALAAASRRGPVLCLYVVEPRLWAQPDAAAQHYAFIAESLVELNKALHKMGGQLHVGTGEVVDVLARLYHFAPFDAVYAHEETGNDHTFKRDLSVGRWCKRHGVGWHEFAQFGVVRHLSHRGQWQAWRDAFMTAPQETIENLQFVPIPNGAFEERTIADHETAFPLPREPRITTPQKNTPLLPCKNTLALPSAAALGLNPHLPPQRQRGGRPRGLAILRQFLDERSAWYRGGISSPLSATTACSRLSAHLAYGTLSLREVVQATQTRIHTLPPTAQRQRKGLEAFLSRLAWHCHFIQKLESEPAIEFQNMHRGYDGLREPEWNPHHFEALTQGRTGWPMVDACVAMLRETGWLNFRMRAMLVSVAAYPLWLHWHDVGLWLARQFLDYEPGIHWSQMQMQSGTTGINTTRVYNPIKQALEHDPDGRFVRRWLPVMRRVPDVWLFEPWRMPNSVQAQCGLTVGVDIPFPVVDLETATRTAKARLHALRKQAEVREAKAAIVEKHASRKAWGRKTGAGVTSGRPRKDMDKTVSGQLMLDF